jgi:lysine-N-methylase
VPKPVKRLQPRSYHAFRCIGADCEDTCCVGWIVNVDKPTYEAYQRCDDPRIGPRLHELVTINTGHPSDDDYARIKLSGPACPFLSEGLCSIQKELGENYLSFMCSAFPRVTNVVDDVLQRSLDLSCPEAARIVLLDPSPMLFDEVEGPPRDPRLGAMSILNTMPPPTSNGESDKPHQYFREIRGFVIWLLQYRAYPLWKRLVVLGSFCDDLHEMTVAGSISETREKLEEYRGMVHHNLLDELVDHQPPQPAAQLGIVLELIVGRIGSDFTPARFVDCYRQFMHGIDWTETSSMTYIGGRYAEAFSQYFAPFLSEHEYMLEHFLVSYVHRTLFPLGQRERSIRDHCMLLIAHYAVIQTVLIGLAGFCRTDFNTGHAIQVIQSSTKTFGHSLTFPAQALKILEEHKIESCTGLAMLMRN